ncbi:GMC family oxidoreductase [Luteibacter aegosomaticola]|uniref:GMC oxidoreductase n=1 Tax=Luteibacter aegosomaticola TaxID=2911538 RepID=UPI001FF8BCC7|nr:GMC oxidoreductase [Luteibacter aegosomaticola]UPG88259.1 GMC family oxidoreductase [Luteibacter aegosomaticola]
MPAEGNDLTLSDEHVAIGMPTARTYFSCNRNRRALDTCATEVLLAIWQAHGASDIFASARSAHTLATCRMGPSPDDAVLDSDSWSFDMPNLYMYDNSIFPGALFANPATISMASGLWIAERFLQRSHINQRRRGRAKKNRGGEAADFQGSSFEA